MRVLLDTNIVLDYLGANQGFTEDAEKVFDLTAKRKDTPETGKISKMQCNTLSLNQTAWIASSHGTRVILRKTRFHAIARRSF